VCIINSSPLPLIQKQIYKLLYEGTEGPFVYGIGYNHNDTIILKKHHPDMSNHDEIDI
jgi:hypothetical protein